MNFEQQIREQQLNDDNNRAKRVKEKIEIYMSVGELTREEAFRMILAEMGMNH